MPPFPLPKFDFEYQAAAEIEALRLYRDTKPGRAIPAKLPDHLCVATWNIANFGVQKRRPQDLQLIAEMLSWFDIAAVQEVGDNLHDLRALLTFLPQGFKALYSDIAGNKERMVFIFDSNKVSLLEKVGEVAIPPSDLRYIKIPTSKQKFDGFDRNPYLAAFRSGSFNFLLVNVHLYFGSDSALSRNRRSLEAFAVARWADVRRKSRHSFTKDIIVLGDFNLPKAEPGDEIYEALTKRGLHLPKHSTEIGSSIASDNHYDQIAFFPGETKKEFTGKFGVFDFDGALFAQLWDMRGLQDFNAYMRYYISDHRILWAEFRT